MPKRSSQRILEKPKPSTKKIDYSSQEEDSQRSEVSQESQPDFEEAPPMPKKSMCIYI